MILHYYFGRRFLRSFVSVLLIFFAVLTLIALIEQIRRFGGSEAGFSTLLLLAALNVPGSLYRILPLIMILATLALFLGLARSSELVVTRAAGRSALKSLVAPVLLSIAIGVIGVAAGNPIVAATQKQYEKIASRLSGQESTLSVSSEGLWLRQGCEPSSRQSLFQTSAHSN
jgi:lipopolysaccharide export system permease protein